MGLRGIADELASLGRTRTLWLGVVSGYAVTAFFAVLLAIAVAAEVLPWHPAFAVMIAAKLVTNTAAFVALRLDRRALLVGGINTVMDAVVMTGMIWATGDTASPLVALYALEVSVLALLTNLTVTVLVGGICLVLFVAMGVLVAQGVLPAFPTPAEWAGKDARYLALACVFALYVIAVPSFYTAGILRRLRANERRLEAQARALIDAGRERAQFMTNLTHELRTPLQVIMGLGELVGSGVYGPATERQAGAMRDQKLAAKRLLSLIDDLLELARHGAGSLELRLGEVQINDLLPTAVATATWLRGDKQLAIEIDAEPVPAIVSDRGKVNQIVLELLSNAIKFTPDGGRIVVRARPAAGGVRIEVEDTGIGIPAAELARVFEEFHQVDGSMSREHGGLGLGLSLVSRLVAALGGTIAVASEPGRGSTFTVTLPAVAPAVAPEPPGARPGVPAPRN